MVEVVHCVGWLSRVRRCLLRILLLHQGIATHHTHRSSHVSVDVGNTGPSDAEFSSTLDTVNECGR